jgi:hypothetical protein
LLNSIPDNPIKHINLWNNQIAFIEEEQPFDCPAVFIEFQPIQWRALSRGVYEAEMIFALHIVTDSRVGTWQEAISVFDLIDIITQKLHGENDEQLGISSITRVRSTTDNLFGELMHNQEVFSCHITDIPDLNFPVYQNPTSNISTGFLPEGNQEN